MPKDRGHTSSVRRLAAILFIDIVGDMALMGKDEDRVFDMLRRNHSIHWHLIKKQFRFYKSIS